MMHIAPNTAEHFYHIQIQRSTEMKLSYMWLQNRREYFEKQIIWCFYKTHTQEPGVPFTRTRGQHIRSHVTVSCFGLHRFQVPSPETQNKSRADTCWNSAVEMRQNSNKLCVWVCLHTALHTFRKAHDLFFKRAISSRSKNITICKNITKTRMSGDVTADFKMSRTGPLHIFLTLLTTLHVCMNVALGARARACAAAIKLHSACTNHLLRRTGESSVLSSELRQPVSAGSSARAHTHWFASLL